MTRIINFACFSCLILIAAGCTLSDASLAYDGFDPSIAGGDRYNDFEESPFINTTEQAISTFSIDADGASYANVRRFITQDQTVPPKGAIRSEELLNYFDLDYPLQETDQSISLNGEISDCPWQEGNKLIRIGIQGREIPDEQLPNSNFIFLIDVSGSMSSEDKLELLKNGFNAFVDQMRAEDRVAIVTYAGSARVVLESTPGTDKATIKSAISRLGSGGGTAGAEGILTAYNIAEQHFIDGGNNRIIIGTDGDFNVGPSSQEDLVTLIEEKRASGIYITVIGVGRGNLNDAALEQIANHGNGTYEYVDHIEQLRKVFIYDYSKFYAVAKDVKVQVEFNPELVSSYRLIGYENRVLETEDFEDDSEDAGEIGAGQNITALYEIVPADLEEESALRLDPSFTIQFRYKNPDSESSVETELEVLDLGHTFEQSSDFMKFSAGIVAYGMLLRGSAYAGKVSYGDILTWQEGLTLPDEHGFKAEFARLVNATDNLQ
ncbi:MAG: VWA domain-containing protein [Cytophagales bacterium]|nr:VWA domain-containing protein [Cytophagales bacterium]